MGPQALPVVARGANCGHNWDGSRRAPVRRRLGPAGGAPLAQWPRLASRRLAQLHSVPYMRAASRQPAASKLAGAAKRS